MITVDKILRVERLREGVRIYVRADERAETDCLEFSAGALEAVAGPIRDDARKGAFREAAGFLCPECRKGGASRRVEGSATLWVHEEEGKKLERCAASFLLEAVR